MLWMPYYVQLRGYIKTFCATLQLLGVTSDFNLMFMLTNSVCRQVKNFMPLARVSNYLDTEKVKLIMMSVYHVTFQLLSVNLGVS